MPAQPIRDAATEAAHEKRFGRTPNVIDEDKDERGNPLPLDRTKDPLPMWKILLIADKAADEAFWQGYDRIAARHHQARRPAKCKVCFVLLPASGRCCE